MSKVRSITPNPPADFTPELGNYKTLQPFRYWCQKVLPLVYDDTLSYYELLCKVVDYLNKTMEDVETLHGDVTNLHEAYEELQNYVNDYFSTLDVQEEINNKLDSMVTDGTFNEIVGSVITDKYGDNLYPIFVESIGQMVDHDKIYVLTTNGHIYYYNGSAFTDSGLTFNSYNTSMIAGGFVSKIANIFPFGNDANNATLMRVWLLNSDITENDIINLPEYPTNKRSLLIVFNAYAGVENIPDDAFIFQIYVNNDNTFTRYSNNKLWSEWVNGNPNYFVKSYNEIFSNENLPPFNDANEPNINTIAYLNSTITSDMVSNLPIYKNNGCLITLGGTKYSNYLLQFYVTNYYTMCRYKGASEWSNWTNFMDENAYQLGGFIIDNSNLPFTDANKPILNKYYLINYSITESDISNLPIYGIRGTLITESGYGGTNNFIQRYVTLNNYFIRYFGDTYASEWFDIRNVQYNLNTVGTILNKPYDFNGKKVAFFGDSIVVGSQVEKPYRVLLAEKMSFTQLNYAVGGASYYDDSTGRSTVISQLTGKTVSDYDYIIIQCGINDYGIGESMSDLADALERTFTLLDSVKDRVIVITPFNTQTANDNNLNKIRYTIQLHALEHGFGVINGEDMLLPYNLNPYTEWYFEPGVHPTQLGHNQIARKLYDILT